MAKAGSVLVAVIAVMLGLFFGYVGVTMLVANENLASAESESWTFLGVFGESSSSASVATEPWMGMVFLVMGGAVLLFGLRALFVAFEGRGDIG